MPLPLPGPLREASCGHCQEINRYAPELWQELLERADSEAGSFTVGKLEVDVVEGPPPAALEERGFDPPDWLAPLVPSLRRCFGDEPPERAEPGAAPVQVEGAGKPVSMSCPECGAGLKITSEMPRTSTCQYCSADFYLPDDLWLRLHPAVKASRWYVELAGESGREREERKEGARRRMDALRAARAGLHRKYFTARTVVLFALGLGAPAGIASCSLGLLRTGDPFFGPHAGVVCPRVCDGCRGPYQFKTGEDALNGRLTFPVWCNGPAGKVEVPTWAWYLVFPLPFWLIWFVLLLPGVAWWAARKDRRSRAMLQDLEREMEALRAERDRP